MRRALRVGLVLAAISGMMACAKLVRAQPSAAGFELAAELQHGAFRVAGAPNVIVHAAPGFDASKPLELVVFLHGYSCCVRALMSPHDVSCRAGDVPRAGWDLARHHDAARTNTLFIVPQLAFLKRDGDPGAFARQGGFRAFLEELLQGPLAGPLGGARGLQDVARIDLVAHSGAYRAALAILERGGVSSQVLRGVVLLDALYGETPSFARYSEQHEALQLVVISLPNAPPARESRSLLRRLTRSLGTARVHSAKPDEIASAVRAYPIVIAQGTPPHRLMPATHLAEVLAALHDARLQP